MKALVLTGGFGTKLKEVIHDRPKVMAPVGGKPFLEYVLLNLRRNGIEKIVLSTGYLGDFISDYFGDGQKFGLSIDYSPEARPLGTGGAVKLAQKFFDEAYFVINGDTYLEAPYKDLYEFHLRRGVGVTIALVLAGRKGSGSISLNQQSRITIFDEGRKPTVKSYINGGVYVFSNGAINEIRGKNRFSLEKDLFPKLAKKGSLYGFRVKRTFVDIGIPQSYQKAKLILAQKRQKVIEVKVPTRVSFAGGGTDLPDYFLKHGGVVIGYTLGKYVHLLLKTVDYPGIKVKLLDFGKEESYELGKFLPYDGSVFDLYKALINKLKLKTSCEITIWADFPAGSGLGSSSAITEAVISAVGLLRGEKLTGEGLAKTAIGVERVELNIVGGWQDQYLCALGGVNQIEFTRRGKVQVRNLKLSVKILKKLEENLMLFYLGGKRSEKVQQTELRSKIENSEEILTVFEQLKKIAFQVRRKLEAGDLDSFGKLLNDAWELKKQSSGKISNVFIDKIYQLARKNGAQGGKLLGAGGGGYLLLYCPERSIKKVAKALLRYNLNPEAVHFDLKGPQAKIYED